ncbi:MULTISPECIES: DUF2267 domain-containing protein [unclassified Pseudonocardia]|uniref:DUF2267 domain-containing protein n=1 Tax=unclassified Pseudonocardia TaxID=2619320 RepID=UPI0001FFEA67|nr:MULTISPECIES: DUF2267 domain-containing protein [unclassified Pseudonocardia]ALE72633.1 hypothetical protein FRP1_05065 [Pseudonocardia sp. EC080625-04]ALL75946.1 hypothetical protein AD006_12700 [Pseudonocardia sp. EC080610-09]ALL82974.1 hypothetical protein AD017_20535 [Pseudonocardia sp. EC080619-01]OLM19900.1 hypothetical protein Ae707Ps1_4159c [Pseudonocardia sp. Ae707_Ps1]
MQYDTFISTVRDSGELPDQSAADRAVRSTLRVLGSRLAGGMPGNLASQLPGDLGEALPATGGGERFDVDGFYDRVADDEGVPRADARRHARATLATIAVAVTDEEYAHLAAQLPGEYADLLQTDLVRHR